MTGLKVRRALFSLTDKAGAVELARGLANQGVEIISTGGTAKHLRAAGLEVRSVSDLTGFPEIMDGRVKTLHPAIHGGLLAVRQNPDHLRQAEREGILLIDLVAVNLYAFSETAAREGVSMADAMESVDIGGPAMIRAAAKNHSSLTVLTDPNDYAAILDEMKKHGGCVTPATRERLAAKAFALTSSYDAAIRSFLEGESKEDGLPAGLSILTDPGTALRYGENPHQRGAFYPLAGRREPSAATAEVLNGKKLSYNNILDIDAAFELVKEFDDPAAVIVKHTNPCGAALSSGIDRAFEDALAGDPQSAFGGILAINRPLTAALASRVADPAHFFEAVIAPDVEKGAVEVFIENVKWGKNVRILAAPSRGGSSPSSRKTAHLADLLVKSVRGGLLVQDRDEGFEGEEVKVVTKTACRDDFLPALLFAWRVAKHVKSNAIVLARKTDGGQAVVGAGAGQMSRIDSLAIAGRKAGEKARGSVMASDAFFPFRDCVDRASEMGVRAIIQPGGSVRDKESIKAADEHGISMIFTGRRHFRH